MAFNFDTWLFPVISMTETSPPGTPDLGDRYIIAGTGGAWSSGTIWDIAQWDGTSWVIIPPVAGNRVLSLANLIGFRYIDSMSGWEVIPGSRPDANPLELMRYLSIGW